MPNTADDPVLDTLLLPLLSGDVVLPENGQVLFLRARTGAALSRLPREALVCDQSFFPARQALTRSGYVLRGEDDGATYPLTLVLPQRQRDENRALLARAVAATGDGGVVMAAQSNVLGAKTFEGELESLAGKVTSLSKNKCRVFWARIDKAGVNQTLLAEWLDADAPRKTETGFISRPGLFAWDRIDAGSQLLADTLPPGLAGQAADLGAGFGYLSDVVLGRYPGITSLDVIEAEKRALDAARQNLAGFGERAAFHWGDATATLPGRYDLIVSNPPFHIDRADRHDIGQAFIRQAAKALKPGGQVWLVANRHLPYEETLKAVFRVAQVAAENGQFKVFKAAGAK